MFKREGKEGGERADRSEEEQRFRRGGDGRGRELCGVLPFRTSGEGAGGRRQVGRREARGEVREKESAGGKGRGGGRRRWAEKGGENGKEEGEGEKIKMRGGGE